MSIIEKPLRQTGLVLGIILLSAAAVLLLSPDEQTLGSGIKSVYVHVALTWTGMAGLSVAGLLGLGSALFSREGWQRWATTLGWVAIGMFVAGFVMSAIAARVNWGAFFWQEPRTNSALQLVAVALIVQGLTSWPIPFRLKGLLHFGVLLFLGWSTQSTPLVLHPGDAARSTSSLAIRMTFLSLFLITSLAAGWLAWRLHTVSKVAKEVSP